MILRSLVITVAVLGCSTKQSPAPMHVDGPAQALTACKTDGDCELVDEGCCGCTAGGKRIAVLKGHAPKRNCEDVMCAQVMSNDPSCFGIARAYCKAGVCAITNANDQAK